MSVSSVLLSQEGGVWSLEDFVEDQVGEIQTFRCGAIGELGSKRPREDVVRFNVPFINPSGGREPNAHPLGKNALQVHCVRDDEACFLRRVNQRSHQELRGGLIGDQNLRVFSVHKIPRRRFDRVDGVHVDANMTLSGVPVLVVEGVELHSHSMEIAVAAVEKT